MIALTAELITQPQAPASGSGLVQNDGQMSGAGPVPEVEGPQWKVGDTCMALYEEDGQHYEAVIEEMLEDGTCTVTYTGYNTSALCPVSQLKSMERLKRGMKGDRAEDAKKSKKDLLAEQREYKRKKNAKKAARRQQIAEEHEQDKNKWLDFNAKTFSKTNKGRVKKSIFATPDSNTGKVGIGTMGMSGKPMTSYQHQEKWKK